MNGHVKHLDHLNLNVLDLEASLDWYSRVFGFEQVEGGVQAGQPWAIVRSGDALLCMYETGEATHRRREAPSRAAINHFALRITDRDAWEATVAQEELTFSYTSPLTWPSSTAWYVDDPSGYQVEVVLWDEDRVSFHSAA